MTKYAASSLVESLHYQPTIYTMTITDPLENQPAKAAAEKSAPAENQSDTTTDGAGETESEFAPWDE